MRTKTRQLLEQRHLAAPRDPGKGAITWRRWRAGGLVHYRMLDTRTEPPRQGDCSFAYTVPRSEIAATLRRIRAMIRGW